MLPDHERTLRDETASLQRRITELEQALLRQRRSSSAERQRAQELQRQLTERPTAAQLRAMTRDISRLEKRLADIHRSRTWRAGRAMWTLVHFPRLMWHRVRRTGRNDQPVAVPVAPIGDISTPAPVAYSLVENHVVREKYEKALEKRGFRNAGAGRNVAMAVSTTDLDAGRGDIYTAIGLGRYLERLGFEVVYLPEARWYTPPLNTDVYVSLLETVRLDRLPNDLTVVAWVRNQTDAWISQPWLAWYDMIFCSSQRSLETIGNVYGGPAALLPIGVDPELFNLVGRQEDREGVVSTVNQWGRERELFTALEESTIDFQLALFGEQRAGSEAIAGYRRGPISFFALPSLYNEARVVLDDFNHTTAGFGNVNSRVFEASACGAPVVTNRALGLDELGLGDIPAYTSPGELRALTVHALESADELKAAEERSRRVLENHSYEVRAARFAEMLQRRPDRQSGRMVIGSYPPYTDNPFAEMMWSELRNQGAIAHLLADDRDFEAFLEVAGRRPAVFHLNWTAPILGAAGNDSERQSRYKWFLATMDRLREAGVPIIWTIHNVLPHECADPELEIRLRRGLAERADIIHVMCEETIAECAGVVDIPSDKVRMIPHPSYADVYPNVTDQHTARFELGLEYDDFVYLYFGQIRPYKGVDLLLDAFDRLAQLEPKAKLLLVGKAGRFPEIAEIKQRARAHPRVHSVFNVVPDDDVQLYMNAANVVVLPYRTALNSGAVQLAFSFAKPVVVSSVGCLSSQVDATTGVVYDAAGGSAALLQALQEAVSLGADQAAAAYSAADDRHYLDIGRRFAAVVDDALAQRGAETMR